MMEQQWPLTGRDDELQLVLDTVCDKRSSVVLAGSAGVGKTRLQTEVIAAVEAQQQTVLRVVGTSSAAQIPFGPLLTLAPEGTSDSFDRATFTRVLIDRLSSVGRQGGVVAVDDAHLLDDLSAAVLHQVAAGSLVPLVLTIRTGEPMPDALAAILKDRYARRFELQPLSHRETETLVTSVLGGVVATKTLARLWEVSAGNPLFVRELVQGALATGALHEDQGVWTWDASTAPSPMLKDLVASRLRDVGDADLRALELLALGEPLELSRYEQLVSPDVVASLERQGLIQEMKRQGEIDVRLVHPIYSEVLRSGIAPRDAQAARVALVEAALSSDVITSEAIMRTAVLHLESEARDHPELLLKGALHAVAATDWILAHKLAAAAHEAAPCVESADVLSGMLALLGRYEESIAVSLPFLERSTGDAAGTRLARSTAWTLFNGLERAEEADRIFLRAEQNAQDDHERQRVAAHRTHMLPSLGRTDEALQINLAALAEPDLDPAALALHLASAGRILASRGRTVDALTLIDQHIAKAFTSSLDDQNGVMESMISRALALGFRGDLIEVNRYVTPLYEFSIQTSNDPGRIAGASALTVLATFAGRPQTACAYAASVLPLWQERGQSGNRDWVSAAYGESLALLGDVSKAEHVHAEAVRIRSTLPRFYHSEITRAGAWIHAARGELSQARGVTVAAADEARGRGWHMFELIALHDAVRLGADDQLRAVIELAASAQGELAAAIGLHADGIQLKDGAMLCESSEHFERLGWTIYAAEAATRAVTAYRSAGLSAAASTAAERARTLAGRCEGAVTPVLAAGAEPDPLTAREREVAQLAAAGMTNKAIAERLVTSVRTVESHLYQVYAKLGVAGRAELTSVLSRSKDQ